NSYKIANPTVLSRISHEELDALLKGYGHRPWYVEGSDPAEMHEQMAAALDEIVAALVEIKASPERPRWPMLVLRSPKGWTGPHEATPASHQVPLTGFPEHLGELEAWMRSYRPEELFDE